MRLNNKIKLKYVTFLFLGGVLLNLFVYILIRKSQQSVDVTSLSVIDSLVLEEEKETRDYIKEDEIGVYISKVNNEDEVKKLVPYSQKIIQPINDWEFTTNIPQNTDYRYSLFYPREEMPIRMTINEKKNIFEAYTPAYEFKLNDNEYETKRYSWLKKEVTDDTVIRVNMEDLVNKGYEKTYKYKDVAYGVEYMDFDGKNLLKKPEINPYAEYMKKSDGDKASTPELSYGERYKVNLESFEPYLLKFDYKTDDRIVYGYRLFNESYLSRINKLKKGEDVKDISKDDWEDLYEETYFENVSIEESGWNTYKKIIEPTLPDIVGIEIFVYSDEQIPEEVYKNFRLVAATENDFLEMAGEEDSSTVKVLDDIDLKEENKMSPIGEATKKTKDLVINTEDLGFERGVWNQDPYDCNINEVGDPELVDMELSDESAEGDNAIKLISRTNHRACTKKEFFLNNFEGDSLKVKFKAKKKNKTALVGYHYVLHGEHGDYYLGEDTVVEDDNYIKNAAKIYDIPTDEWTLVDDYINLNTYEISRIGEIESITIRFNSIRDGGEDAVVLFDDLQIESLQDNLPLLDNLYFQMNNLNVCLKKDKDLILLNKDYSERWGVENTKDPYQYKTSEGKHLWLIEKTSEIKVTNSFWNYGKILVLTLYIVITLVMVGVLNFELVVKFLKNLSSRNTNIGDYLDNKSFNIMSRYKNRRKDFYQLNNKISKKYIRPLLCKFLEIDEINFAWFIKQRSKFLKELDRIFSEIFNDLLNYPILNLILIFLGAGSYLILGNIYYAILFTIFLFWLINEWDSVVLAFIAMVNLCIVPFMLVIEEDMWAEKFSLLVYFFLVMTVVLQVVEYIKVSLQKEQ